MNISCFSRSEQIANAPQVMHESHFLLFVNSYGVVYRNGTKRMDVLITIKAGIGPEKAQ